MCLTYTKIGSSSGIELQAMDKSRTALSHLDLKLGCFKHYQCGQPLSLGINIKQLLKILNCASEHCSMTLLAAENVDTLSVILTGKEYETEFDLKLLNVDALDNENLEIPVTSDASIINEINRFVFNI